MARDTSHLIHGVTEYYVPYRRRLIPVQSIIVIIALAALGLDLIVQSDRWHRTPSYHNLLILLNADGWGIAYLTAGGALAVALFGFSRYRMPSMIAHTITIVLLAVWEVAFIVRWLTDDATTIANVVNWGVLIFLAVRSALLFEAPTLPTTITTTSQEPHQ